MKKSEALDRIVEAIELMADCSREVRDTQRELTELQRALVEASAEHLGALIAFENSLHENDALVAANNREEEKIMAERRERQRALWADDDARVAKRKEMFAKYDEEDSAREKKVVSRDEIDAALMHVQIDKALKVEEAFGDTPSE
jgi:hypothetical protein